MKTSMLFGFLALGSIPLRAAIVYTPQSPLFATSIDGDFLTPKTIDIDGNGVSEFQFYTNPVSASLVTKESSRFVGLGTVNGTAAGPQVASLLLGTPIGLNAGFGDFEWQESTWGSSYSLGSCYNSLCQGIAQEGDGYLGFEFQRGGSTHYGWAHYVGFSSETPFPLTLLDENGVIISNSVYKLNVPGGWIDGWAWEDEPGKSIIAGQIPEPSGMAALAGVAFLVRRKRHSSSK